MPLHTDHPLTAQQQAIVAHTHGPALVFAVAGAGKTTAMVHRIERLVRERIVAPEHVLATTFNKATVDDIRSALARWQHCKTVHVATLHSVGNAIIKAARKRHRLPPADYTIEINGLDQKLLYAAIARVRRENADYRDELETLDHEDFLTYLTICKSRMGYADLERADLPQAAYTLAHQADAPAAFPWYLDLYRIYERERQERGWITFDDMLLTGWELLLRYPDLLQEARARYHFTLVDEFQDVNLVQAELLHLITAPKHNLMAIGDDDQTLYEWRGAHPRFILDFRHRYRAIVYEMTECFRCHAAPLALANQVIRHNTTRYPKQLYVTRGFGGSTSIQTVRDAEQLGVQVATDIEAELAAGTPPKEIAVLVRLYAQTPPIEQALIAAQIPYTVVGSDPFYQRDEIMTMLSYCYVAQYERHLRQGQPLPDAAITHLSTAWHCIANRPKRYLSNDLRDQIRHAVVGQQIPFSKALRLVGGNANARLATRLDDLAFHLTWLAGQLDRGAADDVLAELENRLDYCAYLRESSGFPETGANRVAAVEALIAYARGRGTINDLLAHLEMLGHDTPSAAAHPDTITITTIHRAKGLEWEYVLIPQVNQGTLPNGEPAQWAEERRLLYVALTRTRRALTLYVLTNTHRSRFLNEAAADKTLAAVVAVEKALAKPPQMWQAHDALALATALPGLDLAAYLHQWWTPDAATRQAVARQMAHFYAAVDAAAAQHLALDADLRALWAAWAPPATAAEAPTLHGLAALLTPPPAEPSPSRFDPLDESGAASSTAAAFKVGDYVRHHQFGIGRVVVVRPEGHDSVVTVLFRTAGKRHLLVSLAGLVRMNL